MINNGTNVPSGFILAQYPAYDFNQLSNAACKDIVYLSATSLARSGWELPVRSLIEFVAITDNLYLLRTARKRGDLRKYFCEHAERVLPE